MMIKKRFHPMDTVALLRAVCNSWNDVCRYTLGHAERSLVSELRDVRNRWAYEESCSGAVRLVNSGADAIISR